MQTYLILREKHACSDVFLPVDLSEQIAGGLVYLHRHDVRALVDRASELSVRVIVRLGVHGIRYSEMQSKSPN